MFAWIATRTGVQLPSPPASLGAQRKAKAATPGETKAGSLVATRVGAPRLRLGRPALFVHDPGSNPLSMNGFYYVYILVSELDDEIHYGGVTTDPRSRLTEHNRGKCSHTSKHKPWKIETAVAFRSKLKPGVLSGI